MEKLQFLNRVEIRGIVGRTNIETINNTRCITMSVSTNYLYRDKGGNATIETTWFNVRAFEGPDIRNIDQIVKGNIVEITGRLRAMRYIDENGNQRVSYQIITSKINNLGNIAEGNFVLNAEIPVIRKAMFFFWGSLSVIQTIENEGLNKNLHCDMSQPVAFDMATELIKEKFGKEFNDYDLGLVIEKYEKQSDDEIQKAYADDIEYYVGANDLDEESLKEHDGSGNAQGWTAFLV